MDGWPFFRIAILAVLLFSLWSSEVSGIGAIYYGTSWVLSESIQNAGGLFAVRPTTGVEVDS
jgi:hypothetical protein